MNWVRLSFVLPATLALAITLMLCLGASPAQAQFVCGGSANGGEPQTGAGASATGSGSNVACGTNANATSGTTNSANTAFGAGANASDTIPAGGAMGSVNVATGFQADAHGNISSNTATGPGTDAHGDASDNTATGAATKASALRHFDLDAAAADGGAVRGCGAGQTVFPDAVQRSSAAPQIRDRTMHGMCEGPGSAAHHFMLRCARDTVDVAEDQLDPAGAAVNFSATPFMQ
jgi:hypothetical protein